MKWACQCDFTDSFRFKSHQKIGRFPEPIRVQKGIFIGYKSWWDRTNDKRSPEDINWLACSLKLSFSEWSGNSFKAECLVQPLPSLTLKASLISAPPNSSQCQASDSFWKTRKPARYSVTQAYILKIHEPAAPWWWYAHSFCSARLALCCPSPATWYECGHITVLCAN